MKIASILLLALGAIHIAAAQPAEVRLLTEKRDAAIAKIDSTYQAELAKLKLKYLAAGDSAGADEVTKLLGGSTDAAPAVDPIIGRWRHQQNQTWTVNADGTLRCSSGAYGTWKLVKASPFERKYLMVWAWNRGKRDRADGVLADTVMGRDGKSMKSKFQRDANEVFNLERLDQ